jgi:hypothetical protein
MDEIYEGIDRYLLPHRRRKFPEEMHGLSAITGDLALCHFQAIHKFCFIVGIHEMLLVRYII